MFNEDYALRALEVGSSILSSCEHGYQGNYYECYKLAKKYNLKLLIAAEAYWVWDRMTPDGTNCHIWIGAKNENGRQWLNEILSQANETGFYKQARIDPDLIDLLPVGDVWITSACIGGWKYLEQEEERLVSFYKHLYEKFGNDFFFEVQYHNTAPQKELNAYILSLRKEIPAPLILGCDSHYISNSQEKDRMDFLFSKEMNYGEEDGWYMDYPTCDEAVRRFITQGVLSSSEIEEAIRNTNIFLEVEEYTSEIFKDNLKLISIYPEWSQEQKDTEYERLIMEGWKQYSSKVPKGEHALYLSEINKEMDEVKKCHMADYFIDNYYIIKKGIENGGCLTKTGRGSAVSNITNMLLGFTDVDRIAAKVKMYPERFLTSVRILESGSCPDIDFNVAEQEPFALAQKQILGEDHSYPMIAWGTQKESASWKMFAKSQGVDFQTANEVSSQLKKYDNALKHAQEDDKDNISVYDYIDKRFHEIYKKSEEYQGIITSWSIAPCSYLLYEKSIRREIGLVRIKENLCCLMDGHWAEECHFLKNDLLTVKVVGLIYKAFRRIGMEPPSVGELLEMCPPEDPAWDIYKRGCTIGINQVEQVGTSARVGKYSPDNISELCAFVAAIRPGFKSMYKTFESRTDFSYGVESFDKLMRTEEMPQSFCLYQEQQMAALNYAGFPMAECYTAIKNIAKKRAEKVLALKDKFISGFSHRLMEDERIEKGDAVLKSDMVWQILEDSAHYSFNASHSYCVSLDSLYCAWLKAHHPIEFYETYMKIQEAAGDKDKLSAAKQEAEDYFKIKFPPFKYGQDNRDIVGTPESNSISSALSTIKGFGSSVADNIYEVSSKFQSKYLSDVLIELDSVGVKESKTKLLAKIGYFSDFGNDAEVLRIMDVLSLFKYGEAKKIAKSKIDGTWIEGIVSENSVGVTKSGETAKSYTIKDMMKIIHSAEERILNAHLPDIPFKTKIQNQIDILGYVDLTTGKPEDIRVIFVLDIYPLITKGKHWGYAVYAKSLGSGKTARLTCKVETFKNNEFEKNDVLSIQKKGDVSKNNSGYWYLNRYDRVI